MTVKKKQHDFEWKETRVFPIQMHIVGTRDNRIVAVKLMDQFVL